MKGRKKRDGSIYLGTSALTYLLNLLPDFKNEETMLMVCYGKQMCVTG
jgi:hypothetical protein